MHFSPKQTPTFKCPWKKSRDLFKSNQICILERGTITPEGNGYTCQATVININFYFRHAYSVTHKLLSGLSFPQEGEETGTQPSQPQEQILLLVSCADSAPNTHHTTPQAFQVSKFQDLVPERKQNLRTAN